jgi:GrpB-like predicted nucleotidyltransferase (UPF0157 family)
MLYFLREVALVADERIVVVPYDPEWPQHFERERALLEQVLAPWLKDGVHHVGSTAVPGLMAKPIIDMIAGVRDLEAARAAFEPLRSEVTHGLHLTEPGSDLWRERLAFRDTLRNDGALLGEYAALKLRLAREHGDDDAAYTAGKRVLVGHVLERAGLTFGRR